MKNKLFAVVLVLLLYCVFVVLFTVADNQGLVSQAFSNVGLSNNSAMASPAVSHQNDITSETFIKGNLIDPTPDPTVPRPPPPDEQ